MALIRQRRGVDAPPPSSSPEDAEHHAHLAVRPPPAWMLLLEGRAPWELAATFAASPLLSRLPPGDGHPVVVYPGLAASDFSTAMLRRFLDERGYAVHAWGQGFNVGPRHGVLEQAQAQLEGVAQRHGRAVSLIGWSLGGVYARELAKLRPDLVRGVVTLGTPFAGHPRATNAWWLYERLSGHRAHHDPALLAQIRRAPPVPTTSVYSRTDGIVAWQCSLNEEAPHTENIEVSASHFGIGMNPLAWYVVADRLAQPHGDWRRFAVSGARRLFFRSRQRHT